VTEPAREPQELPPSTFADVGGLLRKLDGFVLLPIEVPGPNLAEELGEWLRAEGFQVDVFRPADAAGWGQLVAWLLGPCQGENRLVMVVGESDISHEIHAAINLLNQRRDVVARRLACPLLWVGTRAFLNNTWFDAPDLWSVRALSRRLVAPPSVASSPMPPPRSRLQELEDLWNKTRHSALDPSLALLLASEYWREKRFESLRTLLASPDLRSSPDEVRAEVYFWEAELARLRSDTSTARGALSSAEALLSRANAEGSPGLITLRIQIYLARGRLFEVLAGENPEREYEQARALAEQHRIDDFFCAAVAGIIRSYRQRDPQPRQIESAEALVTRVRQTSYQRGIAGALLALASLYRARYDTKRAEALQAEALQLHPGLIDDEAWASPQEMILRDLASWGDRHVFGNLRRERYNDAQGIPFLPMDDLYVEPDAQLGNEVDSRLGDDVGAPARPILGLLRGLLDENPKLPVIVKANFGFGKSMTARRLTRDLAVEYLKPTDPTSRPWLPIFINCARDFASETFDLKATVQRARKSQAEALGLALKLDDPALALPEGDQRTLFLLDGLDEVALDHRRLEDLFSRLRDHTSERWRFLVFSRPEALPEPRAPLDYPRVTVLPFSQEATRAADGTETEGQIQRWLGGWNTHARQDRPAISVDDLAGRGLIDLASTPILLFMIAHSWDETRKGTTRLSQAGLYEQFFQQIARGKANADREQHPVVFEASRKLRGCLIEQRELDDIEEIKEPDAMLWLLSRVAWESHRFAQQRPPRQIQKRTIETILEDELKADREAISSILGGVLLSLQTDLSQGGGPVLFGHQSFREFLVARYWAHRLKKITAVTGMKRKDQEKKLFGGRLLGEEDKSFDFLAQMWSENEARWPASSPLRWNQKQKTKIFDWAQECFNDESQSFPDPDHLDLRSDQRAVLREAALAIGCHVAKKDETFQPETPGTLRSMLAWFWMVGEKPRVLAPWVILSEADLSGANLSGANLSGASLSGASLSGANLSEANLSGANLSEANLAMANLNRANLRETNLTMAHLIRTHLLGADLRGANLSKTYLSGVEFFGASLREANLTGAFLARADLQGTNLSGANLSETHLSGSNLSETNLSGADLQGADLQGANLRKANLRKIRLHNAIYDSQTVWPNNFDPQAAGAVLVPDPPDDDVPF